MPRPAPDPLAERVGARVRELRKEAGLTLEKLAYESAVGSKGFLSDIEKGIARPSVATLSAIAERLEVDLLDLFTFPEGDDRHALIDSTRRLAKGTIRRLLREVRAK